MTNPPEGWQPQYPPGPDPQHGGAGYPPGGNPPGGYPPGAGYPPAPPPGYGYVVPDHPKAVTAMILGILGIVVCQVVAPFAWVTGKRTLAEIDASGGRLGGRSQAQTGYILGIVGTVILGLGLGLLVIYMVFMILVFGAAGIAGSA